MINDAVWNPPEIDPTKLKYAVTSSFIEQFAYGHSISDVLRELVQNEYDAHGSLLSVEFAENGLNVRGTGDSIDHAGWQRLSVMIGTGQVAGEEREVPPKSNGIGSKNHGLRALFLIGDRIYVRSGGLQTVLDLRLGAPSKPFPDRAPIAKGAQIFVPYRTERSGRLEPYEVSREGRDMEILRTYLAPMLMKLAQPNSPRSLRRVSVDSARNGRSLIWNQDVKLVGRHRSGGLVVRREIVVRDNTSEKTEKIVELEYQKTCTLPDAHLGRDFPHYFRVRGGGVRLGVSLRLERNRPTVHQDGSFYYPLGVPQGTTGCAVSVSAPFEMNAERTALVDPGNNDWNAWLLDSLANFTIDLVTADWFDQFGAAAYLAIDTRKSAAGNLFSDRLQVRLKSAACWPTRVCIAQSRRPQFVVASEIYLGESPALDAVVSERRRLHDQLANMDVGQMALHAGAHPFSLSSAVRLRCAGEDSSHLKTRAEHALYYTDCPAAINDIELQERFAAAFDAHRRQLAPEHRHDLAETRTTLTASGDLAAPNDPLWMVDQSVESVAPVTSMERLHPRLARYRVISRLCQLFDPSNWADGIASRALESNATEEERERLYTYLLKAPTQIRRASWPRLRRSPIVRDHKGHWIEPINLVEQKAARAERLEAALHFPSDEVSSNPALLRLLQVRKKVTGMDLVRYAQLVAQKPCHAEQFEETLHELRSLLSRSTVDRLHSIAFLRSSAGRLSTPEETYIRSTQLVHAMGENVPYALGITGTLCRKLGCRTLPFSGDIARHLENVRSSGIPVSRPSIVYPLLLDALRREGKSPTTFANSPILHDGTRWFAPTDALLGKRFRIVFLNSVPVLDSPGLHKTFAQLGVPTEPQPHHWVKLFEWIDHRSRAGSGTLREPERRALRCAYARLQTLPPELSVDKRALLSVNGCVYTSADVKRGKFLIDDDPVMADVVANAGLGIAFADLEDPNCRGFYQRCGVRLLSEEREAQEVNIGEEQKGPASLRVAQELGRLHKPRFASALAAICSLVDRSGCITERNLHRLLRDIRSLRFVSSVEIVYRIGGSDVTVSVDVTVHDGAILLLPGKRSEIKGRIARAVASLLDTDRITQYALSDSIYRLLSCDSTHEVQQYLEQRGIPWTRRHAVEGDDSGMEFQHEDDIDVRASLEDELMRGIMQPHRPTVTPQADTPPKRPTVNDSSDAPQPLPRIEQVQLRELEPATLPSRRKITQPGGGNRLPRTPSEQQRDREIGHRAEELIYLREIERVTALGYPAERVIWTSKRDPLADHDICSVADDGRDLWLEVKGTSGRHGRFDWPRAEFHLALRQRDRYVLYRVYEADTLAPAFRAIVDPVGKLLEGKIRLDIATLAAEVARCG
jgi:hypothetical protein